MIGKAKRDTSGEVKVMLVHERSTTNTERYEEVRFIEAQRNVLKQLYIDRTAVKALAAAAKLKGVPEVIEVTLRAVDPKELREGVR